MAFPTIPTTGNGRLLSQNQNNATSPRTFPSLSSLTKNAGDLLLAIVVAYERGAAGATFSSWGASFTERADIDGGANLPAFGIASKVSDGTETGTFTVAQAGVVGHCSLFLMSIAGGGPIQIDWTPTVATGTSAAADPASLNPANWGTEDTLWIAVAMNGETNTSGTWTGLGTPTAPTNYTSANSPGIGTDAVGGIHSAVAFRQNNTAAEDVGTWTGQDTTNARNAAILIAVRPVLVPTGIGTSIFVGSGSEIWNHSPGVTYEDTGLGRMGVRGAPQVTGSGILVVSGSGADAVTWADSGSGILGAVGSGVAVKQSGATEKTGAGIVSDLKGSASDAVTFVKSGAGVLVRSTSASDEVTFTETGSGVRVLVGSASDAVTFTESGAGVLTGVGSGVSQVSGGVIYEKTGLGRMGAELEAATEKAGAGVRGFVGAATDAVTFTETGAGVLNRTGGGTSFKAGTAEKTGTGTRGLVGAASDAVIWQRTGLLTRLEFPVPPSLEGDYPPSFTAVGSGASQKISGSVTYEKTGSGVRGLVGAAADAVTFTESGSAALARSASATDAASFTETGAGVLGASGGGAAVRVSEGAKTGAGVRGFVGSAADAATFVKTGAGVLARTGSGSDAVTFTETGKGVLSASGGGTGRRGLEAEKTGTATSAHTASGADAVTYTETGAAVRGFTAFGADTAQFTKTGAGVLDRYASGEKIKLGEFVKFGGATATFVAYGAVETDLERPPPGFVSSTLRGTITQTKRGRIREGALT